MSDDLYRGFILSHDAPPIPTRAIDWSAAPIDYDFDDPVLTAPTREVIIAEVDRWWEEDAEDYPGVVARLTPGCILKEIPFTQYLLPDGRRRETGIGVAPEVFAKAKAIIEAGYRFEAEILTTGHVSLTVHNIAKEEDVAIEVVPNGSGVREAVCRLVERVAPFPAGGEEQP